MEAELSLAAESNGMAMEVPRWSLEPSATRVAAIDASLRARLAESLSYLAEVVSLADTYAATLAGIDVRLKSQSSHVLLFGVSAYGALTENSGSERYDSPLRPDKRPRNLIAMRD